MTRVAINGFGRIGRSVFRVLNNTQDIELVAINDIFDKEALVYLLKYDTVMGRFPGKVSLEGDKFIPTTTGAARAVGKVLPELDGKLDGISMRVPVPDGSVVDFNIRLKKDVTVSDINDAVRAASDEGSVSKVLQYSTLPVVSTDIIGNSHSSIFDAPFTRVIERNFVKTLNWYDNEWGYSNRVVDLIGLLGKLI